MQDAAKPDLSAFGDVTLVAPLTTAPSQSVWRVELDGRAMVAKATRRDQAALAWLLPVQAAARAAGFLVPEMRATPRGFAPSGWVLETFMDGRPTLPVQMHALHPMLRALHRMAGAVDQRPGFASTRDLMARDLGGDVNLAQMPADLVVALRAAWARMTGAEVALHGDLRESNILMTPQGPALLGWNNARRDLAIYDAGAVQTASPPQIRARLAWEIACCWTQEPTRARALVAEFAR